MSIPGLTAAVSPYPFSQHRSPTSRFQSGGRDDLKPCTLAPRSPTTSAEHYGNTTPACLSHASVSIHGWAAICATPGKVETFHIVQSTFRLPACILERTPGKGACACDISGTACIVPLADRYRVGDRLRPLLTERLRATDRLVTLTERSAPSQPRSDSDSRWRAAGQSRATGE
jgi:hypothetical protein